ncbi:BA14K family protein [Oharaeibacter diazotrophicus]|uniref:Lectin-like protein BA14k n=1 Tax=Oharaeibacter diazotrophicus TaxID=1920512 RepID=A0A4R6RJW3_9HYPH|nr:BA14K family protein [Oharaeibacter diazotrophicus]TDP86395.1 BA14K-like protein [Oharaeibacter diazotrophicus]BBE71662.1 BA14K-like protein [Pleomorphomonas sp. SM30]GLS78427.1 hypothetical protein GCM10007904_37640 [Oharaeibacter diazotrophicus]
MSSPNFRRATCAVLALGMLAPVGIAPAVAQDRDLYIKRYYQNNRHDDGYRDWRRGRWNDNDYRRWYRRHHHHDSGRNLGAAALFGLAAGALAGGIIANQSAPQVTGSIGRVPSAGGYPPGSSGYVAYCSAKYRSFDPGSGTYLGYDGARHYCR